MKRLWLVRPDPTDKLRELMTAFVWIATLSVPNAFLFGLAEVTSGIVRAVASLSFIFGPTLVVLACFNKFSWIRSEVFRWLLLACLWFFQLFVMAMVLEAAKQLLGWKW